MKRNYQDPAYEDFRKKVLKRDGKKCMMPGCKSKNRLQVHHIKKWANAHALRYEISNGITLCKKCHDSIKYHESQYENLFTTIIQDGL
jgi:5-methylcytosine-specific restriction endonuclease McrA